MKTEGSDFLDWLHEVRRKSEEDRQRHGLTYAERLAQAEQVADAVVAELASQTTVARDKPAEPKGRQP
jgi:hypothetical protein